MTQEDTGDTLDDSSNESLVTPELTQIDPDALFDLVYESSLAPDDSVEKTNTIDKINQLFKIMDEALEKVTPKRNIVNRDNIFTKTTPLTGGSALTENRHSKRNHRTVSVSKPSEHHFIPDTLIVFVADLPNSGKPPSIRNISSKQIQPDGEQKDCHITFAPPTT